MTGFNLNAHGTPRCGPRKFSTEDMVRLAKRGLTQEEAADLLGVNTSSIRTRLQAVGLSWTTAREANLARLRGSRPADPPEGSLEATGGRYAALSVWARTHDLTYTQALQRWHRLRRPPEPRGEGT